MDSAWVELFRAEPYIAAFDVRGEHIFLLAGQRVLKLDKRDGQVIQERAFFSKEGLSRDLLTDEAFLYVKDYCHLHILDRESWALVQTHCLGTDSSSDICAMGVDERHLYVSIRNGSMVRLDKGRFLQPEMYPVTDSSIWDFRLWNDLIYAGTVAGNLLIIDKISMAVVRTIQASKQNLKSVWATEDTLITASQDKKMVVRDAKTYIVGAALGNVHKKAFVIVGTYGNLN